MEQFGQVLSRSESSALATNKLIKNTYLLLSMTLIFSAVMAGVSMMLNVGIMANLVSFVGSIVLLWLVLPRTANSTAGVFVVFAITGLLGFGLGPVLNMYANLPNGSQVIATALGGTGVIFLGLSGYALTTKKDFSFMGGFLMVGLLVIFGAIILNLFMSIPALSLAISAAVVLLMSAMILFDTSRIVNGGETNYIMATVALYLDIYNLFIHLLYLLGALSGDD